MAVYLSIEKIHEDADAAEYCFGRGDGITGRARIDKRTGAVVLVAPLPGDDDGRLFDRAAYKLRKHWSSGALPDRTSWAS